MIESEFEWMLSSTLNLQSTWGEKLVHPLRCCWICQSAEQLWGYVLYKLKHTGEPLPLCPKEIWLLWIGTRLGKEAPVEFMRAPQPCVCALSCLGCECRRPQWAATVGCVEWTDVYSPSLRVLRDMGLTCRRNAASHARLPPWVTMLSHSLSWEASVEKSGNGLLLASSLSYSVFH